MGFWSSFAQAFKAARTGHRYTPPLPSRPEPTSRAVATADEAQAELRAAKARYGFPADAGRES
jgi:hypothetical protein